MSVGNGTWEPLEEQFVLLTAEVSLWPCHFALVTFIMAAFCYLIMPQTYYIQPLTLHHVEVSQMLTVLSVLPGDFTKCAA